MKRGASTITWPKQFNHFIAKTTDKSRIFTTSWLQSVPPSTRHRKNNSFNSTKVLCDKLDAIQKYFGKVFSQNNVSIKLGTSDTISYSWSRWGCSTSRNKFPQRPLCCACERVWWNLVHVRWQPNYRHHWAPRSQSGTTEWLSLPPLLSNAKYLKQNIKHLY